MVRNIFTGFSALFFSFIVHSQTLQVGTLADESARSFQLMGKVDPAISFTVRPLVRSGSISNTNIYQLIDSTAPAAQYGQPLYFANRRGRFSLLPVTLTQQINTHHPYGWNDGAMIAAKGYQSLVSAGIYASIGPLEIQLQPEFVYAENREFEHGSQYGDVSTGGRFSRIFPGQTSIRLSAGAVSVGVSTENIWWGPGIRSSLLMSNNAPGFGHVFFASRRPLKTPIGSLEWQLIGGKLTSNSTFTYENNDLRPRFISDDWRYLNAVIITYHPKWVPGLFVGVTRALQRYHTDIENSDQNALSDYLPVLLMAVQKQNVVNDDNRRTDQLASFFMRWVLPKAKAEFYIEYGFNDYGVNVRDYLMAPTHAAAYTIGFKKVIALAGKNERVEGGFELTQMTQSPDFIVRDAGNWYEHSQVLQGYTNENQILGAGAGFGANVQSGTITWINGWKRLGVLLERVERAPLNHDADWTDISIGIMPGIKYKNVLLSGKLQFINSSNYAWEKDQSRFNLHGRLVIQYLF